MSNSQLPASVIKAQITAESLEATYLVTGQNGYFVTLINNRCFPLTVGTILTFKEGVRGVVISVEGIEAVARLYTLVNVTSAIRDDWLPFKESASEKLFAPLSLLGSFSVLCTGSKTPSAGYVGWTFYGPNDQILAMGNDLNQHNWCRLQGETAWAPGVYKLEVRSFIPVTMQPISYGEKYWALDAPRLLLSAGNYNDYDDALALT